jgi:hypothetical protein
MNDLNKYTISYINQKLDEKIDTLLLFEVPQNLGSFYISLNSLNIKSLGLDFSFDSPISYDIEQEKIYLYNED